MIMPSSPRFRNVLKPAQVSSWILLPIIVIAAYYALHNGFYDLSATHQLLFAILPLIFLISFLNTNFALSILIISMLLSPGISMGSVPGRSVALRFDDITLFIVFFGWLARMAIHKDLGFLRISPVNRPIAAYIAVCLVSTCFGALANFVNVKYAVFYIIKYVEYFIIFFMVSNNIRDEKQVKMFTHIMIATSVIVCFYGLYSYFRLHIRASAPFEGPEGEANTLAGYLIILMSLVIAHITSATSQRIRFIMAGILGLQVITILYTLSRTGWLGAIPTIIILIVMIKKGKGILLFFLALALLISPLVIPKIVHARIKETFTGSETVTFAGHKFHLDDSTTARFKSARRSIERWLKSPIIGEGVTSAGAVSDVQYTRILCEVGLVGLSIFIWIIVTLFQAGFNTYRYPGISVFGKNISAAFIASLTGLLVMGVSSEVFIIIRIMEPFWFIAAVVANFPEIVTTAIPEKEKPKGITKYDRQ